MYFTNNQNTITELIIKMFKSSVEIVDSDKMPTTITTNMVPNTVNAPTVLKYVDERTKTSAVAAIAVKLDGCDH